LFAQDIREKKITARGAFHQRGKGVKHGFRGALRTPYYYMTNKEKKKLNGEVQVYKMDAVMDIKEFQELEREKQRELLIHWRSKYENNHIIKGLGIPKSMYFDISADLQMPKKPRIYPVDENGNEIKRNYSKREKQAKKPKNKGATTQISAEIVKEKLNKQGSLQIQEVSTQVEVLPKEPEILNGLKLQYNGEYNSDELNRLFTKLQLLIDGEQGKYEITLTLTETK
jgi:hypothetical protein